MVCENVQICKRGLEGPGSSCVASARGRGRMREFSRPSSDDLRCDCVVSERIVYLSSITLLLYRSRRVPVGPLYVWKCPLTRSCCLRCDRRKHSTRSLRRRRSPWLVVCIVWRPHTAAKKCHGNHQWELEQIHWRVLFWCCNSDDGCEIQKSCTELRFP